MQAVYTLAQRYQGAYDKARISGGSNTSPSGTLIRSATTGKGGVCRDFSTLLVWSINQLKTGANSEEQLSPAIEFSRNHVLVTVKLTSKQFPQSQVFSLDPTKDKTFNPIPVPDLSISSNMLKSQLDRCTNILRCVAAQQNVPMKTQSQARPDDQEDNSR